MVKFFKDDQNRVRKIDDNKNISSKKLKSDSSSSGINKEKAMLLKDKPEKVHNESVIAYLNHHPISIQIKLEEGSNQLEDMNHDKESLKGTDLMMHKNPVRLSISASEWNLSRSDCTQCGQMQDTLRKEFMDGNLKLKSSVSNDDFRKILDIWDMYHLNDIKSGTEKQLELISQHKNDEKYADKDVFLERPEAILKDFKANPDRKWKYGSGFLYRPIPDDVQEFIKTMQRKLNIATK